VLLTLLLLLPPDELSRYALLELFVLPVRSHEARNQKTFAPRNNVRRVRFLHAAPPPQNAESAAEFSKIRASKNVVSCRDYIKHFCAWQRLTQKKAVAYFRFTRTQLQFLFKRDR